MWRGPPRPLKIRFGRSTWTIVVRKAFDIGPLWPCIGRLRSQFGPRSHQMHQEPDLLQLPVRASMGSLELHSDAMGSARRLRRPCARRIDEVPKGARLPARRPWLPSRASLRAAPATTRLSNTTPPPRARSTSPTPPCGRAARSPTDLVLRCATVVG